MVNTVTREQLDGLTYIFCVYDNTDSALEKIYFKNLIDARRYVNSFGNYSDLAVDTVPLFDTIEQQKAYQSFIDAG